MSRRSSRLVSGGYYNSDEESDSSSVTNISYRENPVKVFKKKVGTRKAAPRTPNRDATSLEPPAAAGPSPSPLSLQPTMKTVSFTSSMVTPRPPLTPSLPPKKSGVDSSGYSSSEGPRRTPPAPRRGGVAPIAQYWDRMSRAFFGLKAAPSSLSICTKKALLLLLLLLLLPMCIWLRPPFLTSRSAATETRPPPDTTPPPPVDPAVVSAAVEARLRLLLDSSLVSAAVERVLDPKLSAAVEAKMQRLLDPTVSAAVEAKMQRLLEEQQLKQEVFVSQMQERLQLDVSDTRARLEADRLHLQREVSVLAEQMADQRTDSRSAAAGLAVRLQAVEAQTAKLSVQATPPPAPCPDAGSPPAHDPLTPELRQAVEKWLSDRVKQDAGGGSRSRCEQPMADKMADFALETQGASVISTRCSETYRVRSACVTLFGFPLWYPSESPRTVIQGHPVLLPGKCWAFSGAQGTLVISLSHAVTLTHVTLDHLPRYNSPTGRIDSAPKDFEVYGLKDDVEDGTLLGAFTYDQHGGATQTFQLPGPGGVLHRCVELRVLSNWGHVEYTCLYRFRVHGRIAAT